MKKFISFFIIFKYILSFNDINEYFSESVPNPSGGKEYEIPDKGENEFPCNCDLTENSCDYQCCCDNDCPSNIIEYWEGKQKCTNKKNTLNVFNYKCINEKLVKFENLRKGTIQLNESVKNKKCFGNDNSPKMKDIYKDLNDIIKNSEEKLNKIYSSYIEEKILNTFNFNYTDGNFIKSTTNRKFGLISAESEGVNNFVTDNIFTIYSKGTYGECVSGKKIQFFENIRNSQCLMDIEESKKFCESLKKLKIGGAPIDNFISYNINNEGILTGRQESLTCDNDDNYLVEINFIIYTINGKSIQSISVECIFDNKTINKVPSTFSVNFRNQNDDEEEESEKEKLILFSGTGGYIMNYPLLIRLKDNYLYKYGYVMIGRNKNGICRTETNDNSDEMDNYLYEYDSPILFGQDYNYICIFKKSDVKEGNLVQYFYKTLLYLKASNIRYIGKYGSYNIKNDWVEVDDKSQIIFNNYINESNNFFNKFNECYNKTSFPYKIILNIYVGKIENYYFVHKAKYKVDYICIDEFDSKDDYNYNLTFNTKYLFIEKGKVQDNILYKNPNLPTILPKLPKDLIDPIKDINVNI